MSEEPPEAIVSVVGNSGIVSAEFSDGVHVIPDWAVQELGGPSEIAGLGPVFKQTTFAAAMDALRSVMADRYVNRLQQDVISRHFGSQIPGPFNPQ